MASSLGCLDVMIHQNQYNQAGQSAGKMWIWKYRINREGKAETSWSSAGETELPWGQPAVQVTRFEGYSKFRCNSDNPFNQDVPYLLLLFSRQVMSDSSRPQGLQHTTLPCPSLSRNWCSNSCPLSQGCYLTISSSASHFSSCCPSFPASGSFQWVSSLHQVVKVLELQLQQQSFQWIFRVDFL